LTLRYAALHPPAPLSTPNHTAPPKPYTLSLHDALPIYRPENLVALRAILEPLGQELVSVESGEEVLRTLLHRDDFAVILLDAQMPTMDGFETAAAIKQRERTANIPILFLTAISKDEEHVHRG